METLAFIHIAVNYEDPNPDPEVKGLENLNLTVPNSALMALAGAAVAVSVLGSTSDKAVAATTVVGSGSSGTEVEAIQEALGIDATGKFDAKTQAAVTDFQLRQGLKGIDGVVGPETAKALGLDEDYRPIGFVDTYYGSGLNIRSGPGLGYWRIGAAPDGAYLYQNYESVVYNDGYAWTPVGGGGWVAADYTTEGYYPVGYYGGGYGGGYYPVGYYGGYGGYGRYGGYYGGYYGGGYGGYYPVSYYGGGYGRCGGYYGGCGGYYRPTSYYYGGCGGAYYY